MTKLTDAQKAEIVAKRNAGASLAELSEAYGVAELDPSSRRRPRPSPQQVRIATIPVVERRQYATSRSECWQGTITGKFHGL